jgi:phage gp29-like protein
MNLDGTSKFTQARIEWAIRLRYSPMPELSMDWVANNLNAHRIGEFRVVGKIWEVMMERDAELSTNAEKRYEDVASLDWSIQTDGSPDGDRHAAALKYFYEHLTASEALEQDETGGVRKLIKQAMSAISYRHSVHEMLLRIDNPSAKEVTCEFRHTPVWFFEARRGYLG